MRKPDPMDAATPERQSRQSREARLARALRDNLRRRKAPPPGPTPATAPDEPVD
jgi:hypothetical protein